MPRTTAGQRADILNTIGHFGDMEIPVRSETLEALLADAGVVMEIGQPESRPVDAVALEGIVKLATARLERMDAAARAYSGTLTIDLTDAGIERQMASGEDGLEVRDETGRVGFRARRRTKSRACATTCGWNRRAASRCASTAASCSRARWKPCLSAPPVRPARPRRCGWSA